MDGDYEDSVRLALLKTQFHVLEQHLGHRENELEHSSKSLSLSSSKSSSKNTSSSSTPNESQQCSRRSSPTPELKSEKKSKKTLMQKHPATSAHHTMALQEFVATVQSHIHQLPKVASASPYTFTNCYVHALPGLQTQIELYETQCLSYLNQGGYNVDVCVNILQSILEAVDSIETWSMFLLTNIRQYAIATMFTQEDVSHHACTELRAIHEDHAQLMRPLVNKLQESIKEIYSLCERVPAPPSILPFGGLSSMPVTGSYINTTPNLFVDSKTLSETGASTTMVLETSSKKDVSVSDVNVVETKDKKTSGVIVADECRDHQIPKKSSYDTSQSSAECIEASEPYPVLHQRNSTSITRIVGHLEDPQGTESTTTVSEVTTGMTKAPNIILEKIDQPQKTFVVDPFVAAQVRMQSRQHHWVQYLQRSAMHKALQLCISCKSTLHFLQFIYVQTASRFYPEIPVRFGSEESVTSNSNSSSKTKRVNETPLSYYT